MKKLILALAMLAAVASSLPAQTLDDNRPRTCSGIWPPPPVGEFCNPNRVHGRVDELTRFGTSDTNVNSRWYRVSGWWQNPPQNLMEPYLNSNGQHHTGSYLIKTVAPSDFNVYIYAVIDSRTSYITYWRVIPGTPDDWLPVN